MLNLIHTLYNSLQHVVDSSLTNVASFLTAFFSTGDCPSINSFFQMFCMESEERTPFFFFRIFWDAHVIATQSLPSNSHCLQIHYLAQALLASRSLPSNLSVCHNIIILFPTAGMIYFHRIYSAPCNINWYICYYIQAYNNTNYEMSLIDSLQNP